MIDPLDEIPVDDRDVVQPVPTKFDVGFGRRTMRPPSVVTDDIGYGQVYWLYGASPSHMPSAVVSDPPCSGWGTCFVLDDDGKSRVLFSPTVLKSWRVPNNCYEMTSLQGNMEGFTEALKLRTIQSLRIKYAEHKRRGWESSDFANTERVLKALGSEAPSESEWARLAPTARLGPELAAGTEATFTPKPRKDTGGKAPDAAVQGLKKPVKREGRKGEVLDFFLSKDGNCGSITEATAKFGITRSNLLSQMFMLRKDHNIGYAVDGDSATIQLPEGCVDPFVENEKGS
jgi:hypothetical protein